MAELHASVGGDHGQLCANQPEIVKPPKLSASIMFRIADFSAVLAIPLAGSLLRQSTENLGRNLCFWTLLAFITVMLVASHGGYRTNQIAAPRKQTGLAINCFFATSFTMLSLSVLLGHAHILSQPWTIADLIVTPFALGSARSILANKLTTGDSLRPASGSLVVCYDYCSRDMIGALSEHQISSQIAGILYLSRKHVPGSSLNWPEIPSIQALLKTIHTTNIQDVIFVHHPELDGFAATLHQELLSDLLVYPARIWMAFDIAPNLPALLKDRSGSYKLVPIVTDSLVSSLNVTKRVFDLAVATTLLIVAAPVLLLSACFVRMSGPGPVIFRQSRTGAHGQQFTVLKLRPMAYDPDQPFAQAQHHDSRVTTIGHFLRRTSLDELLQLVNVIKGDMSLVGPRPHAPETQVEGITFENALRLYRLRHRVKPGITGLAQIRGQRGETKVLSMLEQRLASDLEYIQSWSLWLDISIMFHTLPVLLTQTNAW